jgi:uncharacterized protein YcnI
MRSIHPEREVFFEIVEELTFQKPPPTPGWLVSIGKYVSFRR